MIVRRVVGQNILFTRFLVERDYLSACLTRLGHGFNPHSEVINARLHFANIKSIIDELDRIKDFSKNTDVEIPMPNQKIQ